MVRGILSDEEWAFFEPFVIERGPLRGRPPADHRRTLDAIFWIARIGAPWRDLPEELGKWNSVHKQYRRWTMSGLWDLILEAIAEAVAILTCRWSIALSSGHTTVPPAQGGDSKSGSWPLARWLFDQNPCPDQR